MGSSKINPARVARQVYTLAAVSVMAREMMADAPSKASAKKLRAVADFTELVLKDLQAQLSPERRAAVARQAMYMRADVVPQTAKDPDSANLRVLTVDEVQMLLDSDPLDCMACIREGKEVRRCPRRRLLERFDLDVQCEREEMME